MLHESLNHLEGVNLSHRTRQEHVTGFIATNEKKLYCHEENENNVRNKFTAKVFIHHGSITAFK